MFLFFVKIRECSKENRRIIRKNTRIKKKSSIKFSFWKLLKKSWMIIILLLWISLFCNIHEMKTQKVCKCQNINFNKNALIFFSSNYINWILIATFAKHNYENCILTKTMIAFYFYYTHRESTKMIVNLRKWQSIVDFFVLKINQSMNLLQRQSIVDFFFSNFRHLINNRFFCFESINQSIMSIFLFEFSISN